MMKIETVDFFYLRMPVVKAIGDGSQDALLVRVRAGSHEGWGECEAAPLPTIAAWCCPLSHSACQPVSVSVLGARCDSPGDLRRIHETVKAQSMDLLQTDHLLSGIDMALWDLLGQAKEEPVYRLLGDRKSFPKTAYASVLFGDTPELTRAKARQAREQGFRAAKFGWGVYGQQTPEADADQVTAAREGLGPDRLLLIDAGTVWKDRLSEAELRLPALEANQVHWLEEPFVSGALCAYHSLAQRTKVRLAGGEGCHNVHQAQHMIDYGGIGFVQIDAGRIGGITAAKAVADYAAARGCQYVNHTFTTHLALSASLQPYAGLEDHALSEYPLEASPLATTLTPTRILPDDQGRITVPEAPGLGLRPDPAVIRQYLVPTEIKVNGEPIFSTDPH